MVVSARGALLRDHVERCGASRGFLPPGADVVAIREATSSEGARRVFVEGRGWASARVLRRVGDAGGAHAAALAAYQKARGDRFQADHALQRLELLALAASGAIAFDAKGALIPGC